MGIQSITTSIPKAARQIIKKYGPACPVEVPMTSLPLRTGINKYGNPTSIHAKNLFVTFQPNGATIYNTPQMRMITDANGEIRLLETARDKIVYTPDGQQIVLGKSRFTGKPVSVTIYSEKYPKGILIESLTESKTTGKLCSVRNKGYSYYGVTPDGNIRKYNRKNKAEDAEFMAKAMDAEKRYEMASIPVEVLRALYLGKI